MDDNLWKLQAWCSLHDLQESQVSSWWLHFLQAAQLVRAAPFSICLLLLEPWGGESLKLFRCQFFQTYDICLLPASHEPSHPGPSWTKHFKWEEIVTQPTTIAMILVQATSVFYLMVRGWKLSPWGQDKNKNAGSYQSHSMPRWELSPAVLLVTFFITDISDTQIHYWMDRIWFVHI